MKQKTSEFSGDIMKKLQRGPQIVLPKDAGLIITKTGLNKKMRVLDAGAGSGFLAIYLAACAKEVVTYEKDPRWQALAKKNFDIAKKAGWDNIRLKSGDIGRAKEKASSFDLATFDFKDSWRSLLISKAKRLLKSNGWLVLYYPTINQVQLALKELKKQKFSGIEISELIQRDWQFEPGLRPESRMIGHTAFLVFARKG